MSGSGNKVNCSVHGERTATFVCSHLLKGEKLGFNCGYDPEEPDALFPDAWCDECEKVLDAEGAWNDKSEAFADIKLLCSACYLDLRTRNWIQDEEAFGDLVCSSFDYLQEKQDSFAQDLKINDHERWDWYQETGKLVFSHDGIPRVEADIDFSGTLSLSSDTWMWAWANDSLSEKVKQRSRKIRKIGEQNRYLNLASAIWPATEEDGWEMTAIMAKELGSIGAYRTPGDSNFTFMVVRGARWVST